MRPASRGEPATRGQGERKKRKKNGQRRAKRGTGDETEAKQEEPNTTRPGDIAHHRTRWMDKASSPRRPHPAARALIGKQAGEPHRRTPPRSACRWNGEPGDTDGTGDGNTSEPRIAHEIAAEAQGEKRKNPGSKAKPNTTAPTTTPHPPRRAGKPRGASKQRKQGPRGTRAAKRRRPQTGRKQPHEPHARHRIPKQSHTRHPTQTRQPHSPHDRRHPVPSIGSIDEARQGRTNGRGR